MGQVAYRRGQAGEAVRLLTLACAAEPNNPDAFQTIAAYYWDEARNDASLNDDQKREFLSKGVEAADKALALKADFVEAQTFKGLLLRQQALLEKNPVRAQELVKEGTALGEKANDLRKAQTGRSTQ